jgi:hypothetical protein
VAQATLYLSYLPFQSFLASQQSSHSNPQQLQKPWTIFPGHWHEPLTRSTLPLVQGMSVPNLPYDQDQIVCWFHPHDRTVDLSMVDLPNHLGLFRIDEPAHIVPYKKLLDSGDHVNFYPEIDSSIQLIDYMIYTNTAQNIKIHSNESITPSRTLISICVELLYCPGVFPFFWFSVHLFVVSLRPWKHSVNVLAQI